MTRTSLLVALGAAFALGCVAASQLIVPVAHAQQPSAKKWEQFCSYRRKFGPIDGTVSLTNDDLKAKGAEGWELATAVYVPDSTILYCFRRPAP